MFPSYRCTTKFEAWERKYTSAALFKSSLFFTSLIMLLTLVLKLVTYMYAFTILNTYHSRTVLHLQNRGQELNCTGLTSQVYGVRAWMV